MNEKTMKCCLDCNTTKTPLWRGGPAGPKSLCNACGIRYRKRKRVMEGFGKKAEKKKDKKSHPNSAASTSTTSTGTTYANTSAIDEQKADGTSYGSVNIRGNENDNFGNDGGGLSESFKLRLMDLGKQVMSHRSSSSSPSPSVVIKKQRCQRKRKLKEEEQAAFCLMALSCGSVFA